MIKKRFLLFLLPLFFLLLGKLAAQTDECLMCHGDRSLNYSRDGKLVSLYVNESKFKNSIHADLECVDCHFDFDPEDIPHREGEQIYKVDCSFCHDEVGEKYHESRHGQALEKGRFLAPNCTNCHGKHDILPHTNPEAKTYVMNIPELCGSCHKEGTQVSALRTVSQRHILENYKESIHGDGLFKRGLIVTAVCTSCHFTHNILPHEDPNSSINRDNIAGTCMQCHTQIEAVHQKVIRGELWEKQPHMIPACVDCHQPHEVRRVFYDQNYNDKRCMTCHSDENLTRVVDGKEQSLYVDPNDIQHSAHKDNSCIKCHTDISEFNDPICIESGRVDCSICHANEVDEWELSQHSRERMAGNYDAPYCTDCHGSHNVLKKTDKNSPTFSRNVPQLCGKCHSPDGVAKGMEVDETGIVKDYSQSIHGRLLETGLTVTASCVDCHSAHRELPSDDPLSFVHRDNVGETCAKCHLGIYEQFTKSIHHPSVADTDKELPGCQDCHQAHTIKRTEQMTFRQEIIDQCGRCHEDVTNTYFDTFHGKVSKLGSSITAECADCHGSHNILPTYNPKSTLHRNNIIETCQTCHENSNRKFVGYLTHATHHDKDKYPFLYYTFWFMTILLATTFLFFGIHTLLWLPRGLAEKRKERRENKKGNSE